MHGAAYSALGNFNLLFITYISGQFLELPLKYFENILTNQVEVKSIIMHKSSPNIYTHSLAPNGKKAKEATEVAVTASVEPSPNKNNIQEQTSLNKKKLSISTITNTTTSTTTNNSTSVISTSDENNPKQTGLTILERPKRISFCKDPVITKLDINSKTNTMSTFVNQSTQPSVSWII